MGLPHVAVRFYTSPDGRTARRTTLVVLGLVGVFYLLPPVYGALGRIYAPELALTGAADAAVLSPARPRGRRTRRGPPRRAARRRRLRRVPVDGVRPHHVGRRGAQPGRPAVPRGAPLPARHTAGDGRAAGARRRRRARAGGRRVSGWRSPCRRRRSAAARPRHLVAPAHPPGAVAGLLTGGGAASPPCWPPAPDSPPAAGRTPSWRGPPCGPCRSASPPWSPCPSPRPRHIPPGTPAILARLHLPEGLVGRT